jgi:hypothetical protein
VARPLRLETTSHADHSSLDQSITYAMQHFLRRVEVVVHRHHDDSPSHPVKGFAALQIMQPLLAVLGMVASVVVVISMSDG